MNHLSNSRRDAIHALLAMASLSVLPIARAASHQATIDAELALSTLEAEARGRLGVYALDTGSGLSFGRNADRRFGMCSTFKLLLAGLVLREADAGRLDLGEVILYTKADMVPVAPVTSEYLAKGGMRIDALAKATQQTSDNVAGNLLIKRLGGPEKFTRLLREIGDDTTRLDRYETAMNLGPPGEVRDTTTPRAMATTTVRLLTGDLLSATAKRTLIAWMIETKTGLQRLRADLPKDWQAGDKTGTGIHPSMANKTNDVAIIMPPNRAPVVVAAYFESSGYFDDMRAEDSAVLAAVGRVVATWMMAT